MFSVPVIYLRFSPHFLLRPFSPPFPRGRAVLIRSPIYEFREPKGWEATDMEVASLSTSSPKHMLPSTHF